LLGISDDIIVSITFEALSENLLNFIRFLFETFQKVHVFFCQLSLLSTIIQKSEKKQRTEMKKKCLYYEQRKKHFTVFFFDCY